jgi:hypothetical protein
MQPSVPFYFVLNKYTAGFLKASLKENSPIQSSDYYNYGERGIRPSANRADAGVVHKALLLPQSVKSLHPANPWFNSPGY